MLFCCSTSHVQFLVHSHFMIISPFLGVYILLTAPPFDEMEGVRGKNEMKQPWFPARLFILQVTILLLYSQSLFREVSKYVRYEITQSFFFSFRHSCTFFKHTTAASL